MNPGSVPYEGTALSQAEPSRHFFWFLFEGFLVNLFKQRHSIFVCMGLIEDGVKEGVAGSVNELKGRDVNLEPSDDRVDKLERRINNLRQQQRDILEELRIAKFDSVVDDVETETELDDVETRLPDLSGVEERLEMLEIAVDRLESGFEMSSEELYENIIEEAEGFDKDRLDEIESRISSLEQKLESTEIEEKVDKSTLENKLDKIDEGTASEQEIKELKDKINNLEDSKVEIKRKEFNQLEQHVEELSDILVDMADKN